jgi:hypothetical protein
MLCVIMRTRVVFSQGVVWDAVTDSRERARGGDRRCAASGRSEAANPCASFFGMPTSKSYEVVVLADGNRRQMQSKAETVQIPR